MRTLLLLSLLTAAGCSSPLPCEPASCATLGKTCGSVLDGCGGFLDCGACPAGQTCGGAGVPNTCGDAPCAPKTCAALGATCGSTSDGCGGVLDCGVCAGAEVCTSQLQCECVPKTCASQGFTCGVASDGCGGTLSCGTCGGGQSCTANVCGCVPRTCTSLGATCGSVSDGCGGTLSCGTCSGTTTCGGGGTANRCGCTPKTCVSAGANCGAVADGCGGTLSCGTCAAPLSCGATSICAAPASAKVCEDGFCWEDPVPQGHDLSSVWAVSANDVWALTKKGRALHFDGTQWRSTTTGLTLTGGLYAADATHVFAVGDGIRQFDGTTWTAMTSPSTQYLHAVSGTSATDVWAVGANGTILHYDGTSWTVKSSGTTARLRAVHARSATDVWIAGYGVVMGGNGTSFSSRSVSGGTTSTTYDAIFALSATDIFLGDDTGALYRSTTGTTFTRNSFSAALPISGLFGTSSTTMFAVAGDTGSNANKLLAFNGTSWSVRATTQAVSGALLRLHGTSASDVWAVGENGALAHYDGTSWDFRAAAAIDDIVQTAASATGDDLAVATAYGFFTRSAGGFIRRGTSNELQSMHDAWAASPSDVWFVGERQGSGFTWYGKVAHFDGVTVREVSVPLSPLTTVLRGVCGTAANNVWVVGDAGKVLRFNGSGWSNVPSGTTATLNGVWCKGTEVFVVGASSTLLRWNGSAFVAMAAPLMNQIYLSVSGTSASDVWAVGRSGKISHWNGTAWTDVASPNGSDVSKVIALSSSEAWAVGLAGVLAWDGTSWNAQPVDPGVPTALAATPAKVWLAGWDGVMAK